MAAAPSCNWLLHISTQCQSVHQPTNSTDQPPARPPGLDYLTSPTGVIGGAQALAAAAFGADRSFFLVNGCTAGIHAAVVATCPPGSLLLLARNCHMSAFSAAVITGCRVGWVSPEAGGPHGVAHGVAPAALASALSRARAAGERVGAVMVVSPTYFGVASKLPGVCGCVWGVGGGGVRGRSVDAGSGSVPRGGCLPHYDQGSRGGQRLPSPAPPCPRSPNAELAAACHAEGVPLLVDEAHGGHFGPAAREHPGRFPPSALAAGADIAVQSSHKVLTAMTQAAMLHVRRGRVDPERVARALQVGRWWGRICLACSRRRSSPPLSDPTNRACWLH